MSQRLVLSIWLRLLSPCPKKGTSTKNFLFHLLWITVIPLKPVYGSLKNTRVKIPCIEIFKAWGFVWNFLVAIWKMNFWRTVSVYKYHQGNYVIIRASQDEQRDCSSRIKKYWIQEIPLGNIINKNQID